MSACNVGAATHIWGLRLWEPRTYHLFLSAGIGVLSKCWWTVDTRHHQERSAGANGNPVWSQRGGAVQVQDIEPGVEVAAGGGARQGSNSTKSAYRIQFLEMDIRWWQDSRQKQNQIKMPASRILQLINILGDLLTLENLCVSPDKRRPSCCFTWKTRRVELQIAMEWRWETWPPTAAAVLFTAEQHLPSGSQ